MAVALREMENSLLGERGSGREELAIRANNYWAPPDTVLSMSLVLARSASHWLGKLRLFR